MTALSSSNIQPTAGEYRPAAFAASGPTPALTVKTPNIPHPKDARAISKLIDLFLKFEPEPLLNYIERNRFTAQSVLDEPNIASSHIRELLLSTGRMSDYRYLNHHLPQALVCREWFESYLLEISNMDNSTINAERALHLLCRLTDYLRLTVIHKIWIDFTREERPIPPIVYAAMLKYVHCRPKTVSLIVGNFGLETAEGMFGVAVEGVEGFYIDGDPSRPLFDNWECQRVYRGGNCDAEILAMGMSWSLSLEDSRGFARRGIWGDGPGIVIATDAPREDVLGVFDYEHEVVLRPRSRQYEIVEYVTS